MRSKLKILLFVVMIASMLLSACGSAATPTESEPSVQETTEVQAEEPAEAEEPTEAEQISDECPYKESPLTAERVANGELPGVCERLPDVPLVFTHDLIMPEGFVESEVGVAGGTMVSTIGEGAILLEPLFYSINRIPVVTGSMVFSNFQPNADFSEYEFTLRKGLKWSDGVPLTTADIDYAWNDVLNNVSLYPTFPAWLRTGGQGTGGIPTLTIVDEFTYKMTYDAPYPGLSMYLAGNWQWTGNLIKPKHYLSQFHEKYADAATLAAAVTEAGYDEWYELHGLKDVNYYNENAIGMPRLDPWIPIEWAEDRYVLERNPYYGSVDTAGQQLPYFDTYITYPVSFTAPETAELMMFSGEGHYNWNLDLTKLPLYKSEEAKGIMWAIPYPNKDSRAFYLNLTYDDPTWRLVVQDVRFRQAIGLAMDCEEINKEIYLETATIPTVTHDCVYDPEAANALLDEMGMTERDADGFRLAPNGEPFELPMTLMAWDIGYNSQGPFLEKYFEAVGVNTSYKMMESQNYWDSLSSNTLQATIIWSFSPKFESDLQWPDFQPTTKQAPLWYEWGSSGGAMGEEPPDWVKESFEIQAAMSKEVFGSDAYKALEQRRDEYVHTYIPFLDFVEQPGIVHMFNYCLGNVAKQSPPQLHHHGSWTQHRLIFFKPGCDPKNP